MDTAEKGSVQEALFHFFELPIDVIAEPSAWYAYRRMPMIVEVSDDQTRGSWCDLWQPACLAKTLVVRVYTSKVMMAGQRTPSRLTNPATRSFTPTHNACPPTPPLEPIHWVNIHQTEVTFRTIEKDK
jgi:hypothetical protein